MKMHLVVQWTYAKICKMEEGKCKRKRKENVKEKGEEGKGKIEKGNVE
jgi:hypothetical protein